MRDFVNREAMVAAAEMEVRAEARRHPDDPWTPDRDNRWAARSGGRADLATTEFAAAVVDARKRLRGECLAMRADQIARAANLRELYQAEGWPVPTWARNVCSWAAHPEKITALYEFDDDGDVDLDNAIAALHRAIA